MRQFLRMQPKFSVIRLPVMYRNWQNSRACRVQLLVFLLLSLGFWIYLFHDIQIGSSTLRRVFHGHTLFEKETKHATYVCLQRFDWYYNVAQERSALKRDVKTDDSRSFSSEQIQGCFQNHTLLMGGDENMRQLFEAFIVKSNNALANSTAEPDTHSLRHQYTTYGSALAFMSDTSFNSSTFVVQSPSPPGSIEPEVAFRDRHARISGWLYLMNELYDSTATRISGQQHHFSNVLKDMATGRVSNALLQTHGSVSNIPFIITSSDKSSNADQSPRNSTSTNASAPNLTWDALHDLVSRRQVYMLIDDVVANNRGHYHPFDLFSDGTDSHFWSAKAELLLKLICSHKLGQKDCLDPECCYVLPPSRHRSSYLALISFVSPAILACLYAVLSYARAQPPHIRAASTILGVLMYCWIAGYASIFSKASKSNDVNLFIYGIFGIFAMSVWHNLVFKKVKRHGSDTKKDPYQYTLLCREQTEEWKGWMQAVILLYHYFGLSNTLWIYQIARVLVAAYLFLTGYNHTSYLQATGNFSFNRFTSTLVRLNLLSCILPLVMTTSWEFYYFPGLSSFWYLAMYISLRSARSRTGRVNPIKAAKHLILSFAVVQTALYSSYGIILWQAVSHMLKTVKGPQISPREWAFRLKLDSIVPFLGALFALSGPKILSRLHETLRKRFRTDLRNFIEGWFGSFLALGLAVFVTLWYFLGIGGFPDKFVSNKWHPFTSIVPIMAYLVFRHVLSSWGLGYNCALQWLGSISLETYILQSHIWMTDSNKKLVRLTIFGQIEVASLSHIADMMDSLLLTVVFLLASDLTAGATRVLTQWLTTGRGERLCIFVLVIWGTNLYRYGL